MRNPIKNLGDYNTVRDALKMAGGSMETLYKSIGDTAVSKAAPKLLLKGSLAGVGLCGIVYIGHKLSCLLKERKQRIENEPALKKAFIDVLEADLTKMKNEELADCDETK